MWVRGNVALDRRVLLGCWEFLDVRLEGEEFEGRWSWTRGMDRFGGGGRWRMASLADRVGLGRRGINCCGEGHQGRMRNLEKADGSI